jgi:pimeloyl-ACP methyl ester carboxylesterase
MLPIAHARKSLIISGFVLFSVSLFSTDQAYADYPKTQLARLSNGRCLEYAEYGDPTGPLVLYFHGTPGSHLEVYGAANELRASGIHILAINRPGIGNSSYQSGRKITDWPNDVSQFLAATGHGEDRFGIIGFSGGTPYALACARAMPQRVTRVVIVSGHTSLGVPGVAEGNADRFIRLFIKRPKLARVGVKATRKRLNKKPDKIIARVTKEWDPQDRKLVACDPLIRAVLEKSLKHAIRRGEQGIVKDTQLLGCRWGFDLSEVNGMPISIWHGRCDRLAPISMGRYFDSQLANSTLHVGQNAGHVTMFKWNCGQIYQEFSDDRIASSPEAITRK